jgi:2-succinyl-5-enolpyruvyl-6-hydroxy-3-cyclohexene-1-carboxylate synthase
MYSSADERSAAYMACGLACESGEAVVLTCTEATASRNYVSGLTEAYYRKLPVLAITATNTRTLIGQNHPQMIDRSQVSRDIAKKNLYIPFISRDKDVPGYVNLINDALLELFRDGGGPVHIEYETEYSKDYSVKELPCVQTVKRYTIEDKLPDIPKGKLAIISGAHKRWDKGLTDVVERFCEKYNAVFLADHISNYHGKYAVNPTIVTSQTQYFPACCEIDTVIYIGDISSAYRKNYKIKNVWRVNPDGEIRNVFGNQSIVFEMSEAAFFNYYCKTKSSGNSQSYYNEWKEEQEKLYSKIPEIPFSNLWCAQHTGKLLPAHSALFLGIENTLRCWNFFETPGTVDCFCNTGGFGIDGGVSSLVGASLANSNKLYFGITGDLAFFYDMNVLGNRHIGKNIRLMVVNNAIGQQFKNPRHPAQVLGDAADKYVAAAGHYGNKSPLLLKHYAEDLGCEYLSAATKHEYLEAVKRFVSPEVTDKPMVFEVFTDSVNETEALKMLFSLEVSASNAAKGAIKKVLGDKGVKAVKDILGK